MQIYRGMTIGTAAPTAEEMDGVRHHMVAIADPAESWSVARFTEQADLCIGDILRRGKCPVLVGGTGLYLDSILSGRTFAPGHSGGEIRKSLQAELAREGIESLYRQLREIDPETAMKNASSGPWRSTGRPARPSPPTMPAPASGPLNTGPAPSASPSGTGPTSMRASTAGWTPWWSAASSGR